MPLELSVTTPLDSLRNREIKSNIESIIPEIEEKVAEYKNTQYGITQERLCREHRALLNKFLTAINDEVKAVGEANNAPFIAFKESVEPAIKCVTDGIKSLDAQLNEMEGLWRTNNLENAKVLYDAIIGTGKFGSWIPWEKVLITKKTGRTSYEDFFGNKTSWSYAEGYEDVKDLDILRKAGKKVADVFEQFNSLAQEKLDIINNLDYSEEIKKQGIGFIQVSYDPVKKGFDTDGAFAFMARIKRNEDEKREAVERAKREAEEKAKREAEEAQRRAEAEKQAAIDAERRKAEEAARRAEEERRRALEEERRKAEEAQRKAVEEARKEEQRRAYEKAQAQKTLADQEKRDNVPWEKPAEPKPDEKKLTARFEVTLTIAQAKALRAFCGNNGITLKKI